METLPLFESLFQVPDSDASGCVFSIFTYCDSYCAILSAVMAIGASGSVCPTSMGSLWVETCSSPLKSCADASLSDTSTMSPRSKVLLDWLIESARPAPASCVSSARITMKGCWFPPPLSETTIPHSVMALIASVSSFPSAEGLVAMTSSRISAMFVFVSPSLICLTEHVPVSVAPM